MDDRCLSYNNNNNMYRPAGGDPYQCSGAERVRRRARVYFRSIGIIRSARAYLYALFTRALSALRDATVISVSRGRGCGFPTSHASRGVCTYMPICTRA